MFGKIIDGKLISQEVKEQLKIKVADFEKKHGRKIFGARTS